MKNFDYYTFPLENPAENNETLPPQTDYFRSTLHMSYWGWPYEDAQGIPHFSDEDLSNEGIITHLEVISPNKCCIAVASLGDIDDVQGGLRYRPTSYDLYYIDENQKLEFTDVMIISVALPEGEYRQDYPPPTAGRMEMTVETFSDINKDFAPLEFAESGPSSGGIVAG